MNTENESAPRGATRIVRSVAIGVALAFWFATQALLARRAPPANGVGDALLSWTAGANAFLHTHPAWANALLVASSLLIDALGIFLLLRAIFGPTIRPFLGLLLLFALRQICQSLVSLPPPEGMIWRSPGFPSLLVTYGTSSDFFFSGHSAIAVLGALELARLGRAWLTACGVAIAVFLVLTVVVLRAHYTMDIFTGVVAALWIAGIAAQLAPAVDRALLRLIRR
jgi:hypothetical protein